VHLENKLFDACQGVGFKCQNAEGYTALLLLESDYLDGSARPESQPVGVYPVSSAYLSTAGTRNECTG
jgi:hypothetical protein